MRVKRRANLFDLTEQPRLCLPESSGQKPEAVFSHPVQELWPPCLLVVLKQCLEYLVVIANSQQSCRLSVYLHTRVVCVVLLYIVSTPLDFNMLPC